MPVCLHASLFETRTVHRARVKRAKRVCRISRDIAQTSQGLYMDLCHTMAAVCSILCASLEAIFLQYLALGSVHDCDRIYDWLVGCMA